MFTKEFVIELCEIQNRNKKAIEALHLLKSLNIINRAVEEELSVIKSIAFIKDAMAVNYILSFIPEELLEIIGFERTCVSSVLTNSSNERVTLDTELLIYGKNSQLNIVFDYKNQCCYLKDASIDEFFLSTYTNYIKVAPKGFNHYIEYSLD